MDCKTCNGNGEVGCYKCGGHSTEEVSFSSDGHTHTESCNNCSGTGQVTCHHCFGNGNIE